LIYNKQAILKKLQRYCAYQDRCHQEVRTKLIALKVYGDDLEDIVVELINENFLNEERYARSYTRGKFRLKKWGRNKIKRNLAQRRVSSYCVKKGMEEIDEEDYLSTLKDILTNKMQRHDDLSELLAKDKAIKYASSRGYEADLIFKLIKEIENDEA